jgi:hypothetical protein
MKEPGALRPQGRAEGSLKAALRKGEQRRVNPARLTV